MKDTDLRSEDLCGSRPGIDIRPERLKVEQRLIADRDFQLRDLTQK